MLKCLFDNFKHGHFLVKITDITFKPATQIDSNRDIVQAAVTNPVVPKLCLTTNEKYISMYSTDSNRDPIWTVKSFCL